MPQMAPMSWLILFMVFSLIYMMFNILNFYLFNYLTKENKINHQKNNEMIWKW